MVYPFQHNNALEPANPHRGASGAVWRGSRKATARKLAAFREPHAKPCSQARKSRCARFSMLRAPARLNSSTAATSPQTRSGSRLSAALTEQKFKNKRLTIVPNYVLYSVRKEATLCNVSNWIKM